MPTISNQSNSINLHFLPTLFLPGILKMILLSNKTKNNRKKTWHISENFEKSNIEIFWDALHYSKIFLIPGHHYSSTVPHFCPLTMHNFWLESKLWNFWPFIVENKQLIWSHSRTANVLDYLLKNAVWMVANSRDYCMEFPWKKTIENIENPPRRFLSNMGSGTSALLDCNILLSMFEVGVFRARYFVRNEASAS